MQDGDFGISTESVSEALEYAKQCVPLVLDNIISAERGEKIAKLQQANIEQGFDMFRLITDSTLLISIRLFVEAKIKVDLDSSFKLLFASMIGGLEEGDLLPSDFESFYGSDGYSQAYRKARISYAAKIQKKVKVATKGWEDDRLDKFWDNVLTLTRSDFCVIDIRKYTLKEDTEKVLVPS